MIAPEQPPETLYHYCSLEAFLGIIQSKSIWLSDYRMMNDHMELKWATELTKRYIHGLSQIPSGDLSTYTAVMVNILTRRPLEFHGFGSFVDELELQCNIHVGVFLAAFSTKHDSLSQWRAYADDGRGLALGFNSSALNPTKALDGASGVYQQDTLTLDAVNYQMEDQEDLISGIVDEYRSISLLEHEAQYDNFFTEAYLTKLLKTSLFMKNPSFEEEGEWRLANIIRYENENAYKTNTLLGSMKFRPSAHTLVPFFEYPIRSEKYSNSISKVILGPKNQTPRQVILQVLESQGFVGVEVINSSASYR